MATRNRKAPAKAGAKMIDRTRVAYAFDDGDVVHLAPAEVLVQQILQWSKMAEFDDPEIRAVARERLHEVARAATEKGLMPIANATGGNKAAKTKAKHAASNKERAIKRFRVLTATGERDAAEAMTMMQKEGFSRSSLYRHLAEELEKRRKPVKRRDAQIKPDNS